MATTYRCPKCGESGTIAVNAVIYVALLLTDDGPQFLGAGEPGFTADNADWIADSDCWCEACNWDGSIKQVILEEKKNGQAA